MSIFNALSTALGGTADAINNANIISQHNQEFQQQMAGQHLAAQTQQYNAYLANGDPSSAAAMIPGMSQQKSTVMGMPIVGPNLIGQPAQTLYPQGPTPSGMPMSPIQQPAQPNFSNPANMTALAAFGGNVPQIQVIKGMYGSPSEVLKMGPFGANPQTTWQSPDNPRTATDNANARLLNAQADNLKNGQGRYGQQQPPDRYVRGPNGNLFDTVTGQWATPPAGSGAAQGMTTQQAMAMAGHMIKPPDASTQMLDPTAMGRYQSAYTQKVADLIKNGVSAPPSTAPSPTPTGLPTPQAWTGYENTYQNLFGNNITSEQRTPEHNAAVGGVPNSQHIAGTAFDATPAPQNKAKAIAWAMGQGMTVIDDGTHLHFQNPTGGGKGQYLLEQNGGYTIAQPPGTGSPAASAAIQPQGSRLPTGWVNQTLGMRHSQQGATP